MKLKTTLPDRKHNGLHDILGELINDPTAHHLVIGYITTEKTVINHDKQEKEVTIRVVAIEPVIHGKDRAVLDRVLRFAQDRRNGTPPLQIEAA